MKVMPTSQALEGTISPMGSTCHAAPNGWHMTTMQGVCVHCGTHTCEGRAWCKHVV